MKLKKFIVKKHTLLKFHLIKYQAYKNRLKKDANFKLIDNLQLRIKQALNLIHLYHFNNKRILFIGFPYTKKNLLARTTKHAFIPKSMWIPGIFGNKNAKIHDKKNKTHIVRSLNLTNAPDLVILFNATPKDLGILKEVCSVGCPVLIFGCNINFKSANIVNEIPAYFYKKPLKQMCSFLIYSILKKI